MPEWINHKLVTRLVNDLGYVEREVGGVLVLEPQQGVGPAYVQSTEDPGWWQFLYFVAVGVC